MQLMFYITHIGLFDSPYAWIFCLYIGQSILNISWTEDNAISLEIAITVRETFNFLINVQIQ